MKKPTLLLVLLSLFISSCIENKKDSKKIKGTNNSKITQTDTLAKKTVDYKVKIQKVDSLITYLRPENYHQLGYQTLLKKYNPNNQFESKLVELNSSELFIQSASIEHRRFRFPEHNNYRGYIIKKLTQNYRNVYVEGGGHIKNSIQIFPVSTTSKIQKKPLYDFNAYGDHVQIYFNEGYFLSTQYGCCMSSNTYELFDLNGKYLVSSNDNIKSIKTENNQYFIGILKNEIPDIPVLFIKEVSRNTQYISFSLINFDNIFEEQFYLKFKDDKSPFIPKLAATFSEYNIKTLDELEIWIPFNKTDTLKIPFKNQKAFGIEYPQIKASLVN